MRKEITLNFSITLEDSRYCSGCPFLQIMGSAHAYCEYFYIDDHYIDLELSGSEFKRCPKCIKKFGA